MWSQLFLFSAVADNRPAPTHYSHIPRGCALYNSVREWFCVSSTTISGWLAPSSCALPSTGSGAIPLSSVVIVRNRSHGPNLATSYGIWPLILRMTRLVCLVQDSVANSTEPPASVSLLLLSMPYGLTSLAIASDFFDGRQPTATRIKIYVYTMFSSFTEQWMQIQRNKKHYITTYYHFLS